MGRSYGTRRTRMEGMMIYQIRYGSAWSDVAEVVYNAAAENNRRILYKQHDMQRAWAMGDKAGRMHLVNVNKWARAGALADMPPAPVNPYERGAQ